MLLHNFIELKIMTFGHFYFHSEIDVRNFANYFAVASKVICKEFFC